MIKTPYRLMCGIRLRFPKTIGAYTESNQYEPRIDINRLVS